MKLGLPTILESERTPLVQALLAILDAQYQRIQQMEETVQQLRDEIAILKGQKPKPQIAPSQLEKPPKAASSEGQKRPGSEKRCKNITLMITEERRVSVPDPPAGSVHLCYESFVVQELQMKAVATRYFRQRIKLLDGGTLLAPLPEGLLEGKHFGPELVAYIVYQYRQCNVTQPLLLEHLWDLGIDISAGQVSNILTESHEEFHREKAAVLAAGLQSASYIGVDDTGARHQGHTGYCTSIGNEWFAYFESTDSKNRLNFLRVLRGTHTGYVINEVSLAYFKRQKLSQEVFAKLNTVPLQFSDEAAWQARLVELGITLKLNVRIATEGALLGQIIEQGVSPELVILSDGAGQFDVLVHASCWVHAERPLSRLVPYNEAHRVAVEQVQQQLWELYRDLKKYREHPEVAAKPALEARFDALVGQESRYPTTIGYVLKEMRDHKGDLLRVLERPEVPLHNNAAESDIRGYVKIRKINGGTRSDLGRRCRDTFSSLKKTCRKLGLNFWTYLQDRLQGRGKVPWLPDLICQRAAETNSATLVAGPT